MLRVVAFPDHSNLIAKDECDLQEIALVLNNWCELNSMFINFSKGNVVRFRSSGVPHSDCVFKCGECTIDMQYISVYGVNSD